MYLICVDKCPACDLVKLHFPDIPVRKPQLKDIIYKTYKEFPALVLKDRIIYGYVNIRDYLWPT